MRALFAMPLAVMLAGCLATSPPPVQQATPKPPPEIHTPVTLTKGDVAAIQSGVRASLKDPESAKFGRMVAGSDSKGQIVVCLMVNAKNSYGGYTGEKPYMGMLLREKKPASFIVVPTDDRYPQHRDEAFYVLCRDYGLSPVGA